MSGNPEGVPALSPGLPYSATLGDGVRVEPELFIATLKGLRPILEVKRTSGDAVTIRFRYTNKTTDKKKVAITK